MMDDLQAIMLVYKLFALVVGLIYIVYAVAGLYKMFEKAGFPGWLAFIPILNILVTFKIAKLSAWLYFLLFVPIVNIVLLFIYVIRLSNAFGKNSTYSLLSILFGFITIPLLGYTDAMYKGDY